MLENIRTITPGLKYHNIIITCDIGSLLPTTVYLLMFVSCYSHLFLLSSLISNHLLDLLVLLCFYMSCHFSLFDIRMDVAFTKKYQCLPHLISGVWKVSWLTLYQWWLYHGRVSKSEGLWFPVLQVFSIFQPSSPLQTRRLFNITNFLDLSNTLSQASNKLHPFSQSPWIEMKTKMSISLIQIGNMPCTLSRNGQLIHLLETRIF